MAEARDLLAATNDRFTEGFGTGDVVTARRLIAELVMTRAPAPLTTYPNDSRDAGQST